MSTVGFLVVVLAVIATLIGIFFLWAHIDTKRESGVWEAKREREKAEKRRRQINMIRNYPVMKFTLEEFNDLPRDVPRSFLKTCEIGTLFVCSKSDLVPDVTVVGQVVKGSDLFCDQWGAGLSVPERGINRYQVKIVEPTCAAGRPG